MLEETLEIESIASRLADGEEVEINGSVYVRKVDIYIVSKRVCAKCLLYECDNCLCDYCVMADVIAKNVGHLEKIN